MTEISSGQTQYVYNTATSVQVDYGGRQYVESGGVAVYTSDFGLQYVEAGGSASATVVEWTAVGSTVYSGVQTVYGDAIATQNEGTQYIKSGGYAYSTTNGGDQYIESGGVALITYDNGYQQVDAGGIAITTSVGRDSVETVYGQASNTDDRGTQYVESGGESVSGTISAYTFGGDPASSIIADQYVRAGGESIQETIGGEYTSTTSAYQYVQGTAYQDTVANGGVQYVESGGVAQYTLVSVSTEDGEGYLPGSQFVESGGISYSATTDGLGTVVVNFGGVASNTDVRGEQDVYGDAEFSVIYGREEVYYGGYSDSATISGDYAEQQVYGESYKPLVATSGAILNVGGSVDPSKYIGTGLAESATVSGTENISSGGVDDLGLIYGSQSVSWGGIASRSTVYGSQTVLSGGLASASIIQNGYEDIQSGGVASGAHVAGDGIQSIAAGGSATSSLISRYGLQIVYGSAVLTIVEGKTELFSGGESQGAVVNSGGTDDVFGGQEFDATISGVEHVYGYAEDATLSGSGAVQYVYSGGETEQTNVYSGGTQRISSGGVALYTLVYDGGLEVITSKGVASASEFGSGARMIVSRGGRAVETFNDPGGLETVLSGGVETGGEVDGVLSAASGATITHETVDSGGADVLFAGAIQSGVVVSRGGILELVSPASFVSGLGPVKSATIISGATLRIGAILDTRSATVSSGSQETVHSGGAAFATVVLSGGSEVLAAGGVASGATVSAGGLLSGAGTLEGVINDRGRITGGPAGLTLASGGTLTVAAGATARNVTVLSGAKLVDNGALYVGAVALAGALSGHGRLLETGQGVLVLSGDGTAFSGRAVISGGAIEVASAEGLGSGSVTYAAVSGTSAALQLDSAAEPANNGTLASLLSNFEYASDVLDLRGTTYVAGATASVTTAGDETVLTLHDGGYTASFDLAGAHATQYKVTSDSAGGVLVTASGSIVSSAASMAQAMASFGGAVSPDAVRPVSGAVGGERLALYAPLHPLSGRPL